MIAAGPRPATDAQAGFTLLELLVAIVLLSLLSLVLTSSLRFGLTAWARGAEHVERIDNELLAQEILRHIVGDAYPYFVTTDPTQGFGYVDFAGTSHSLRFLASAPAALGGRGRVRFTIALERGSTRGGDLIVATVPELADASAEPARKILMSNVESVAFAYFGRKRSDPAPTWHDAWSGEPTLPQLVRVRVRLPSGHARLWPDLILAPRITADVGCVHDPLTKRCRGR
jgi:general secretion pathway protein J